MQEKCSQSAGYCLLLSCIFINFFLSYGVSRNLVIFVSIDVLRIFIILSEINIINNY